MRASVWSHWISWKWPPKLCIEEGRRSRWISALLFFHVRILEMGQIYPDEIKVRIRFFFESNDNNDDYSSCLCGFFLRSTRKRQSIPSITSSTKLAEISGNLNPRHCHTFTSQLRISSFEIICFIALIQKLYASERVSGPSGHFDLMPNSRPPINVKHSISMDPLKPSSTYIVIER